VLRGGAELLVLTVGAAADQEFVAARQRLTYVPSVFCVSLP
jgi:hypothetical protein